MRVAAVLLAAIVALPSQTSAWGFDAHKFIAERMIALLPPELKPLFEQRKAFIIERSIDPDLWRNVGWEEEPPNHFLDFDYAAYGPYPFEGLPRDYSSAVQKFGKDVVDEQGRLPWRTAEFYGRLQREFESLKRPNPPTYALDNIGVRAVRPQPSEVDDRAAAGQADQQSARLHVRDVTRQQSPRRERARIRPGGCRRARIL